MEVWGGREGYISQMFTTNTVMGGKGYQMTLSSVPMIFIVYLS